MAAEVGRLKGWPLQMGAGLGGGKGIGGHPAALFQTDDLDPGLG